MNIKALLTAIANDPFLLEIARKAIEDTAIEYRDSRISVIRNNGMVCKEKDGTRSSTIRFGPETAVSIGLLAIVEKLDLFPSYNGSAVLLETDNEARD